VPREPSPRLRQAEARLAALAAAAGEMIWITSPDGLVTEDQPSWCAFTGQSPTAVRGPGWLEAIHPEDRPQIASQWEQARASETLYISHCRIRDAQGSYHHFALRAAPAREADGSIREWVGVCHEITRRIQAEEENANLLNHVRHARDDLALRAAEQEAILDAASDGLIVHDRRGAVVWLNATARALLGLDALPEYQQLPMRAQVRLLHLRDEDGHPLPTRRWPLARVLRGETLTGAQAVDLLVRRLDGRDMWVSVSSAPIRDGEGQIIGAVSVFRDVSTRHEMERRTREALDALVAMAEALVSGADLSPGGPVVVPVHRPPSEAGPSSVERLARQLTELVCRLLSCQRAAVILIDPADGHIRSVALVGESYQYEHRLAGLIRDLPISSLIGGTLAEQLRRGEVVSVDLSGLPFQQIPYSAPEALIAPLLINGEWIGVLGLDRSRSSLETKQDDRSLAMATARMVAMVLERERLLAEREAARARELALREANARMDEFLSVASHELKTPITAADLNVQVLTRWLKRAQTDGQLQTLEAHAEDLDDIIARTRRQTRKLGRLVDDLLDATRIHKGTIKLNPALCPLLPILTAVLAEERAMHPSTTIHLETTPEPENAPTRIFGDADRIGQVITNYLNNAVRYSPPERAITVRLERQHDTVRISVRDEGKGIPLEEQERIWGRFERVEGEEQEHSGAGLGLGLYISRAIVEGHGGHTGVESAPGAGATFWFALPVAPR
jgi:PAS domain S-box-containing protein